METPKYIERECSRHGLTRHRREKRRKGGLLGNQRVIEKYRCVACDSDKKKRRREYLREHPDEKRREMRECPTHGKAYHDYSQLDEEYYCIACRNERNAEIETTARRIRVHMNRELRKLYHELIRRNAAQYLGGRCKDCGLEDECYDVYDFHHRDPALKSEELNEMFRRKADWDEIKTELDKCDMLCAVCHRRRHGKKECCKR